ncbi:hypothetical protein N7448_010276 [Penicillium atrosanguineum]|uniref:Btz domain-containing protein n=1 Tax=Penicillium atrosanguineum TaxID=1132637 RepID=A0A9W9GH53_9EURO|nr:uncharacterized protein N7443_007501 [Penicillium atrosanguineum]KAJ5119607.1 hypothetical protein N7448_010276 [Penicillium atrosanguineum]KAJ5296608.1 hypothetical protein N7443_007501 [Penicillium atrosanguineum]KAJ5299371.1 hypothetical protein N7476_010928 [Penicillium atrosanguineum]
MAPRRRHIGASRRKRREDEGEDEGSLAGDVEDDSLSEGSADSRQDEDADGEGSESDHDTATTAEPGKVNGGQVNGRKRGQPRRNSTSPRKPGLKTTVSDTEAMMKGLKISGQPGEDVHFDEMEEGRELQTGRTPSAPPTEPKRETLAAKKRREHEKYVKERGQNPAFVPTRGSFFLHDKRTNEGGNGRTFNKGKSRPVGLIVDGNARRNSAKPDASEGQWAHDLHDTVAGDEKPAPKHSSLSTAPQSSTIVPTAPRSSPPNRSFSSTTLMGNASVRVFLPGMAQEKPFPVMLKKHTRLPQHRPPLRRDKPVRISLPSQPPRYIFPSTERSFIFIPRALRPNQQGYRGRGRGGGFYSGRRPSYYSNTYTPSVLSRRSSLGMPASQDGYPSPAGSVYSRPVMVPPDAGKPVVRLPPPPRPPVGIPPMAPGAMMPQVSSMPPMGPMQPMYQSRAGPIPMHQPRPQKAVSVADIESPVAFPFNPPQPQQEQPFHHQVPGPGPGPGQDPTVRGPPSQASGTPLSQIPERAIHAQPFQPYGYPQQPGFYPSYQPGNMYYGNSGPEYPAYNGPMGPGTSVPNFNPGQQAMPYAGEQPSQADTVAHESGGTVYFYQPGQVYPNPNYGATGSGAGGVVGMGGMMTPPSHTYYYQQPPGAGGVYYGQ